MNQLETTLAAELRRLAGFASSQPQSVTLPAPDQVRVEIDFTAVDTLSCAFREVRLDVPALAKADFETLKQWGRSLCSRITYLLEHLGPIELDPSAGEVLIRSTPPDHSGAQKTFYEVTLQSHSGGRFSLRRYRAEKGTAGRTQVDVHVTHEVLQKLVRDLVQTIPVTA